MSLADTSLPQVTYDYVKNLPPKVIDHISPSQLGKCMRVQWLSIKHYAQTTPPSPGALVNFQLGFLFEELFTKALKASEIEFQDQLAIYDEELNVAGTTDFVLRDVEKDEYEVIDTKTESMLASGYRKREHKTFLQAHPEYEVQLGTYMMLLKRQGKNVTRGRFVVIIKDNGMMSEHFVILTPELETYIMGRINQMNHYLSTNTLPPCTCEGWEIGYCGYGNPKTRIENKSKKIVNSECCPGSSKELESWRT